MRTWGIKGFDLAETDCQVIGLLIDEAADETLYMGYAPVIDRQPEWTGQSRAKKIRMFCTCK